MTKEWKYVYNGFDYEELYDLRNDPDEMTYLYGLLEFDHVVKSLSKRLWSFAQQVGDVCVNPPDF